MIECGNAHAFCTKCIAQDVDQRLEQGHHKIVCLNVGCAEVYQVSSMRHFLQATTFNRLISLMQKDELREANVENLCSCPFCDFAMVIDNPNEKLFTCLNPKCLKVSCRECKDLNHIPLRCNEVEKDEDIKMRTYIEEKCAEALIRKCPKCSRPIIKDAGCNKMACPCGTYFCYVCNKKLDKENPYAHFSDGAIVAGAKCGANRSSPSVCKTITNMAEVHEEVALKAAKEAREKYLQEHPQMKDKAPDATKLKQMVGLPANYVKGRNIGYAPAPVLGHYPPAMAVNIGLDIPRAQLEQVEGRGNVLDRAPLDQMGQVMDRLRFLMVQNEPRDAIHAGVRGMGHPQFNRHIGQIHANGVHGVGAVGQPRANRTNMQDLWDADILTSSSSSDASLNVSSDASLNGEVTTGDQQQPKQGTIRAIRNQRNVRYLGDVDNNTSSSSSDESPERGRPVPETKKVTTGGKQKAKQGAISGRRYMHLRSADQNTSTSSSSGHATPNRGRTVPPAVSSSSTSSVSV